MNHNRRVADYVVERIATIGTNHVFGVGGANIEDLYDAIDRFGPSMTGIVAKHEFGAATMADGYARTTNRLGVVAATSGGGALNLVAALGESFDSRVPVLALVGQPPTKFEGIGAFQDTSGRAGTLNATTLFGQVSRWCQKATSAAEVPELLDAAIAAARSGGPATLLLPKDIQQELLDNQSAASSPAEPHSEPHRPDMPDYLAAQQLLTATASGPAILIAGSGVARADARAELLRFAESLGAGVVVTPDAKDVFPQSHPLFVGVSGVMGHRGIAEVIGDAALCVVVGTPLTMTERGGLDPVLAASRILHIGDRPPFVDAETSVGGELREALNLLADNVTRREPLPNLARVRELEVPDGSGPGVRYRPAMAAIGARLRTGDGVFADAGNTGAAAVHYLPTPDDGRFVVALGMGGMGYAFGAGIGSAIARERRTYVLAGDGAFFMHGLEVHTAVEHQVPVTFIVFNNNAHAMCITREQIFFDAEYSFNRFSPANIGHAVAAMFPTLTTRTVQSLDELTRTLDELTHAGGPAFVCVECDPDEIPPFAPLMKEVNP
ncbi:acetolactate synthase large subunit [Gordonia effusa NBRC 100432]|uniref:acetolactate synthase n=1 Tax=Gordonia effusa NBRC 100432 TaxID=1077974 RepID=H0R0M0_9ACTN|nr:thiamine pyrophosphate-binding protein [Gordonia effusa]GAB18621.1 acetolactate synthase large subunit [Gordonia effusa NBRC 100432]